MWSCHCCEGQYRCGWIPDRGRHSCPARCSTHIFTSPEAFGNCLCGLSHGLDLLSVSHIDVGSLSGVYAGFLPERDAPLISQLKAAHGVVLGKTRMHELAEGYTSISSHYGAVLNPYRNNVHVGGGLLLYPHRPHLHTLHDTTCKYTQAAHLEEGPGSGSDWLAHGHLSVLVRILQELVKTSSS